MLSRGDFWPHHSRVGGTVSPVCPDGSCLWLLFWHNCEQCLRHFHMCPGFHSKLYGHLRHESGTAKFRKQIQESSGHTGVGLTFWGPDRGKMAPAVILLSFSNNVAFTKAGDKLWLDPLRSRDHLVMNSCCQGNACAVDFNLDYRSHLLSLGHLSRHPLSTGYWLGDEVF